jgi:FtsZ-binding cell division protein ZapB
MKTPRIVLLAVLAACGVGAAVIWRTTALEEEIAQLKRENAKLSADADAATAKTQALEAESAQLRAARAMSGVRLEPVPAATPAQEQSQPPEQGGFMAKMFKDPDMRKMLETQQTAALRNLYSDYLKEAQLTPDETERFLQVLLDRQMALMDSSEQAMSGGTVDMKAATAAANTADDALKDLLGPARFGQYEEFERTLGVRMQVRQFGRQLAADGEPLDDSENAALIRIMSEENAAMPPSLNGLGPAGMSPAEIDQYSRQVEAANQRVYNRAMSVLTPAQLGALAIFQKNMATAQVAGLKMAQ